MSSPHIKAKMSMIDKKELRSGNIVNVPHGDIVIDFLMQEGVHLVDGCGGNWQSLEPVPLSPEWLERLGFVKLEGTTYSKTVKWNDPELKHHNPPFDLDYFNESMFIWFNDFMNRKVETVHELQNLYFALTGTELTLKL